MAVWVLAPLHMGCFTWLTRTSEQGHSYIGFSTLVAEGEGWSTSEGGVRTEYLRGRGVMTGYLRGEGVRTEYLKEHRGEDGAPGRGGGAGRVRST